jgi:hypothetical protein
MDIYTYPIVPDPRCRWGRFGESMSRQCRPHPIPPPFLRVQLRHLGEGKTRGRGRGTCTARAMRQAVQRAVQRASPCDRPCGVRQVEMGTRVPGLYRIEMAPLPTALPVAQTVAKQLENPAGINQ